MTASILLVAALTVGQAPVEVKTLAGQTQTGSLVSLSANELVIDASGGPQTLAVKDVLRVAITEVSRAPSEAQEASVWVELIDGSSLVGKSFLSADGTAKLELLSGAPAAFPTRAIRTVRLMSHEGPNQADLAKQWDDIVATPAKDDVLVIRKKATLPGDGGQERTVFSLDYLGGVLYDVSDATVAFEFEGEKIDVPREKVAGMIYYHAAGGALPPAVCRIVDRHENSWSAASASVSEGKLKLVAASGVAHEMPLEAVEQLDFSTGKLVYLSDLKPEKSEYTPYIEAKKTPAEAIFNQPRFDRTLDGQPLRIGETTYAKGVALRSRTRITWRLPPSFRRLLATAGIDYHADANGGTSGDVQLIVLGDDKPLFDQRVTGRDGPVELDVDVTGVKRLTVVVDYGGGIDAGDYLDLGDARVTK